MRMICELLVKFAISAPWSGWYNENRVKDLFSEICFLFSSIAVYYLCIIFVNFLASIGLVGQTRKTCIYEA